MPVSQISIVPASDKNVVEFIPGLHPLDRIWTVPSGE